MNADTMQQIFVHSFLIVSLGIDGLLVRDI